MDSSIILNTLKGHKTDTVPVWFMRQAGRYLSEYRAVRAQFPDFLRFCYTPDAATEVTLQPIKRFGFDAAILFSDILVVPDALGQQVAFQQGEGPVLQPVLTTSQLEQLSAQRLLEHLNPVFSAIRQIRAELPKDKTLIGFSGSPWTLACYMTQGKGSKEFDITRQLAYAQPEFFSRLIDLLTTSIITYLRAQIEAGVQVVQLFDSWAGLPSEQQFTNYVISPTQTIVAALKQSHPDIPIIGFAKGAGAKLKIYGELSGVDALGIDQNTPLMWAKEQLKDKILQGNLDNMALASNKQAAVAATQHILQSWADVPFIFNLGHGILPHTPIENVEAVLQTIREYKRPRT